MINTKIIPGMIEACEQEMLFHYASNLDLKKGNIVELGTFFGKSTSCLINGISQNASYVGGVKLYSYDQFSVKKNQGLYPLVLNYARKVNLETALIKKKNTIEFQNIYSFFTSGYEDKVLKTYKISLNKIKRLNKPIILLFIDCPKEFFDTKKVLECFLSDVLPNGIIVFQDFFYFWSAGQIALVNLLLDLECIEIVASCASSLIVKKKKIIQNSSLIKKMILIEKKSYHLEVEKIKKYINNSKINLDRYDLFYPRIIMAQIQDSFIRNDQKHLNNYIHEIVKFEKYLKTISSHDMLELISQKFKLIKN